MKTILRAILKILVALVIGFVTGYLSTLIISTAACLLLKVEISNTLGWIMVIIISIFSGLVQISQMTGSRW